MTTITKFIAEDGKEFTTEKECLDYEEKLKNIRAEEFLKKNSNFVTVPDVFNVYDATVSVVHLESEKDLELLDIGARGPWTDSYIKESAESLKLTYPCDVVLFSNDSYSDIYNPEQVARQLLDAYFKVVNAVEHKN